MNHEKRKKKKKKRKEKERKKRHYVPALLPKLTPLDVDIPRFPAPFLHPSAISRSQ